MSHLAILACLVVSLPLVQRAALANLLTNGGFESGDFTGWTVGGNAASGVATDGTPIASDAAGNYVHPRTGTYAAYATLQASPSLTTITLTQPISVVGGTTYLYTYRFGPFADPIPYASFTSKFYVDGNSTGNASTNTSLGNAYHGAGSSFVAPVGSSTVLITAEFSGKFVDTNGPIGFSIDDLDVSPLPEPSGIALLTLAIPLGLRRRRRLSRKFVPV